MRPLVVKFVKVLKVVKSESFLGGIAFVELTLVLI